MFLKQAQSALPTQLSNMIILEPFSLLVFPTLCSCLPLSVVLSTNATDTIQKRNKTKSEIAQFVGQVNFLLWHLCRISPVFVARWAIKPNLMSFNDADIYIAAIVVGVFVAVEAFAKLGAQVHTKLFNGSESFLRVVGSV